MARVEGIVLIAHLTLLSAGVGWGGVSGLHRADGRSGTITYLGDNVSIYSDPHGNSGPVITPQGIGPAGPHGEPSIGTTPFGSPPPPNNLTPPPVLPINPNRPLLPQQSPIPSPATPPQGFGPSSGGRFGR